MNKSASSFLPLTTFKFDDITTSAHDKGDHAADRTVSVPSPSHSHSLSTQLSSLSLSSSTLLNEKLDPSSTTATSSSFAQSLALISSASLSRSHPRILIVGAGLSGLSLAVGLRHFDIDATIIERDAALETRNQGFNLTLKNIEYVWSRAGLLQAIRDYNCTTRSYFTYKYDGTILQQFALDSIMCCPRELLRDTMLKQLKPTHIFPGTSIKDLKDNDDGSVSVSFSHGVSATYDLVVGADGIRSSITQRVLPSSNLNFLGVVIILGTATTSHPRARNRFQMLNGHHRLFCKPWSETKAFWQVTFPATLDECYNKYGKMSGEQVLTMLNEVMGDWASPVPEFLSSTDAKNVYVSPLFDREPTLLDEVSEEELQLQQQASKQESDVSDNSNTNTTNEAAAFADESSKISRKPFRQVALIGDAAHSMSPFRGEGANNAMEDGIVLADMIGEAVTAAATTTVNSGADSTTPATAPVEWSGVIRTFHRRMMTRTVEYVMESRKGVAITHDPRCIDKDFIDQHWDYKYKLAKLI